MTEDFHRDKARVRISGYALHNDVKWLP